MKTNYLKTVVTILFFSLIFIGCSKEEAFYSDNFGNKITPETYKHPIVGKKSFQCSKYFSTGNFWESYNFDAYVWETHLSNVYVIGPISLDSYGKSGQKIESNSSFLWNAGGDLDGTSTLKSSYDYLYGLTGKYDFFHNKIKLTLTNFDNGQYCGCEEK
jgi:hypothetical protein